MRSVGQVIGDYDNPNSLGSKLRARRSGPLRRMIEIIHEREGEVSVLDVGGIDYYWNVFPDEFYHANRVRITLLNLPKDMRQVEKPWLFTAVEGNGCSLPYADDAFDICHSNSVIEHVGNWQNKLDFAREVQRVAPNYIHQTPNYLFPWEPHLSGPFLHWLPAPMLAAISFYRGTGWHGKAKDMTEAMSFVEHASMLTHRQFAFLFPKARIVKEKFLGLSKSFTAMRYGSSAAGKL